MTRSAFTQLVGRLHRQLGQHEIPLASKESQKLLRLLNQQVQTELDRKHPGSASVLTPPVAGTKESPYDSAVSHMGSILSNPLFTGPRARSHLGTASKYSSEYKWSKQVATGEASMEAAQGFLLETLRSVADLSPTDRRSTLRTVEAASQVLSWFKANDGEDYLQKIRFKPRLSKLLIYGLVAEGKGAVVLQWLNRTSKEIGFRARMSRYADLLSCRDGEPVPFLKTSVGTYIDAHRALGFSADAVIGCLLDCWRECRLERKASSQLDRQLDHPVFGSPCRTLVQTTFRRGHEITEATWILLMESGIFPRALHSGTMSALFKLYHPTKPVASGVSNALLRGLARVDCQNKLANNPHCLPLAACADAAQLLIEQKDARGAARLLREVSEQIRNSAPRTRTDDSQVDLAGLEACVGLG